MRYAGIDEATPELARDARRPTQGRFAWLEDLTTRVAVAATLGAAVVGAVLWLARAGRAHLDVTRAGGHLNIVRCPVHGISYDAELEECTECAKSAGGGRPRHLASVPASASPASPSLRPLPRSVE